MLVIARGMGHVLQPRAVGLDGLDVEGSLPVVGEGDLCAIGGENGIGPVQPGVLGGRDDPRSSLTVRPDRADACFVRGVAVDAEDVRCR